MSIHLYFLLMLWASITFSQSKTYTQELQEIKQTKIQLQKDAISSDSVSLYLTNTFYNKIFPHWVGTTWDYNGYTNIPQKGEIACGYFISTTLKHMGFNWNRFKLAQMYSSAIIKATCTEIKTYTQIEALNEHMIKQPVGIYIVGLSNHVGFIIKTNRYTRFVHSNYINNEGPISERLLFSEALKNSTTYWIGKFTNQENIQKWLNESPYNFK